MQNLLSPRWMVVKAALFVLLAALVAFVVLWQHPSFRFAGLGAFAAWWWRRRKRP